MSSLNGLLKPYTYSKVVPDINILKLHIIYNNGIVLCTVFCAWRTIFCALERTRSCFAGRFFVTAQSDRPVFWHWESVFGASGNQARQGAHRPGNFP